MPWTADSIIGNIRKQYIDTRTQANLSKLNANRQQDLDIPTQNLAEILARRRNSGKHLHLFSLIFVYTFPSMLHLCIIHENINDRDV